LRVVHVHRIRGVGGSERHLLALLPALRAHGLDVVFVGLDDPAWDPRPFYDSLDVETVRLPAPRDLDPVLAARLRRELRGLRADVVHTHLVHADLYGALAARRAALVSTKHNDDPFRAGPFRYVERGLTRRAGRVIAISESLRRFNIERVGLPAEKIDVVHYGLDAPPVAWSANPESDVPADARVLLAICRLVPQKGLDVAVAALARVRERHPQAALVVLGAGPERIAGEGVHVLGRVGDVGAWLERAELLVHPVRWEGFGIAVLEAMLAGVPVVASAVSSIPELVVDGETGYLVPPDDPDALADALIRVLDDPGALGEAGRRRAHAEFSVERMARRTLDVYTKAR
jgi:glycosyltransferase involved in cell wall biosynthesis